MGIAERREREKTQRRNDIIDAAERVFFARGFESSTMDDVAEEAELSKGTLYLYFKSKEDLYLAIHLRGIELMKKLFQDSIRADQTGIEQVRAIGDAYFAFFNTYPEYFNVLSYYETRDLDPDDEESLAALCFEEGNRALALLVEALHKGSADGTIRSDLDPFKTALILWGQTMGLIIFATTKGELIELKYGVQIGDLFSYYFAFMIDSLKISSETGGEL